MAWISRVPSLISGPSCGISIDSSEPLVALEFKLPSLILKNPKIRSIQVKISPPLTITVMDIRKSAYKNSVAFYGKIMFLDIIVKVKIYKISLYIYDSMPITNTT